MISLSELSNVAGFDEKSKYKIGLITNKDSDIDTHKKIIKKNIKSVKSFSRASFGYLTMESKDFYNMDNYIRSLISDCDIVLITDTCNINTAYIEKLNTSVPIVIYMNTESTIQYYGNFEKLLDMADNTYYDTDDIKVRLHNMYNTQSQPEVAIQKTPTKKEPVSKPTEHCNIQKSTDLCYVGQLTNELYIIMKYMESFGFTTAVVSTCDDNQFISSKFTLIPRDSELITNIEESAQIYNVVPLYLQNAKSDEQSIKSMLDLKNKLTNHS